MGMDVFMCLEALMRSEALMHVEVE